MRIFSGRMFCEPLRSSKRNKSLIQSFTIDREQGSLERNHKEHPDIIIGLEDYLKRAAWEEDENGYTKVYVIKTYLSGEVVAYFALKAGMISYYERIPDEVIKNGINAVTEVLPGIEISHFAVNDEYRRRHGKGGKPLNHLGEYLYPTFIYPIIERTAALVGVSHLYLYAAGDEELVNYYRNTYGFEVNKSRRIVAVKPFYDDGCTFMYRSIKPV